VECIYYFILLGVDIMVQRKRTRQFYKCASGTCLWMRLKWLSMPKVSNKYTLYYLQRLLLTQTRNYICSTSKWF